jgi:DNA mismatch endonuclease (patch repair protein)
MFSRLGWKQGAMDTLSREHRTKNMAAIRSRDTAPELKVRRALFKAGLRYRLYDKRLPGRPDIVFSARSLVVFVHGCFWHGCTKCVDGTRKVKSNKGYWSKKIRTNKERDARNVRKLVAAGWRVEEIWECETSEAIFLARFVRRVCKYKPLTSARSLVTQSDLRLTSQDDQ